MCTYGRRLERLLAHTYGQGSCTWLGRNGESASSSCSWGANRLGRNGMRRRVHREGLDGTADGNKAWHTAEQRKRPCVRPAMFETGSCSSGGVWRTAKRRKRTSYGRNGVLLIGRGVAYRKTEETDLCWSAYGRNRVLFIGRVVYRKMGLHGSLFIHHLLPRSSLHGLLLIHHRLPPASTCYYSSIVDFLLPPLAIVHAWATVHPTSTDYYSTSPP